MNFSKNQDGITFIGFLFVTGVIVFFVYMGIRLIPVYIEHYGITKSMKMVEGEITTSQIPSVDQIRGSLYKKFGVQYVDSNSVPPQNIKINYQNGGVVLQIAYEKRVPFMYNIDFVVKYENSVSLSRGID